MFAELTREDLTAGLDQVVVELLAEAGVGRPPVDAFQVARRLGITVAIDAIQGNRARYVRLDGRGPSRTRPTILLRPDPRREREQWAVAHEIGEHAAHRVFAAWGVDFREVVPKAREEAANQVAGRLLLPNEWFTADAEEAGWDLVALKARYATASHELIARRMLDCRPAVIISIFDQKALTFRRSNVAGRAPPLSPGETACWREAHARNRPVRIESGPRTVQGWPVHEDGWKREILRAEVEEWGDDW
jgi:hypothetical protein